MSFVSRVLGFQLLFFSIVKLWQIIVGIKSLFSDYELDVFGIFQMFYMMFNITVLKLFTAANISSNSTTMLVVMKRRVILPFFFLRLFAILFVF